MLTNGVEEVQGETWEGEKGGEEAVEPSLMTLTLSPGGQRP
jgi:hypothetical protein